MPKSPDPHVGIVTGSHTPELTEDGRTLSAALRDRGYTVEPVVWDDPSTPWSEFDCLVIRSCWNYYERPAAFREWLATVETRVDLVLNRPALVRWNVHKFYLRDLQAEGIDVLPTAFVEQHDDTTLESILSTRGWDEAVVKPAVGTSSDGVWRVSAAPDQRARERFETALADGDLLVQQFAPEIHDGELSLVFFAGEYSHATRSTPAADDFRAHPDYGNTLEPATPPEAVVEQARRAVTAAASICECEPEAVTYARVDGVVRDGAFRLMELELVEPYLDISRHADAPERFADAVAERLD